MLGILRRIALSMSGVRGPEQGGRGETGNSKSTRNSTSGRREVVAGAKARKRVSRGAPARVPERPPRRGGGQPEQPAVQQQAILTPEQPPTNYTQPHRTATEIIALHEAAAKRMVAEANEPKRLTQKQLDDIVKGQMELESAMLYGQQQRQITQEQMNHQMGMVNAGLQNSVASMLGISGTSDPLQGIPRDRPYWESFYGGLGKGMMPHVPNRGGGK